MNRVEFEALRDFPDKFIRHDILFTPECKGADLLTFDRVQIEVEGHSEFVLYLNGAYNRVVKSTKFNVVHVGTGPICRLEANCQNHKDAGRHHKHSLTRESDPRKNLPEAVARPDLIGLTPRQVFEDFCRRGHIQFTGTFHDPK